MKALSMLALLLLVGDSDAISVSMSGSEGSSGFSADATDESLVSGSMTSLDSGVLASSVGSGNLTIIQSVSGGGMKVSYGAESNVGVVSTYGYASNDGVTGSLSVDGVKMLDESLISSVAGTTDKVTVSHLTESGRKLNLLINSVDPTKDKMDDDSLPYHAHRTYYSIARGVAVYDPNSWGQLDQNDLVQYVYDAGQAWDRVGSYVGEVPVSGMSLTNLQYWSSMYDGVNAVGLSSLPSGVVAQTIVRTSGNHAAETHIGFNSNWARQLDDRTTGTLVMMHEMGHGAGLKDIVTVPGFENGMKHEVMYYSISESRPTYTSVPTSITTISAAIFRANYDVR